MYVLTTNEYSLVVCTQRIIVTTITTSADVAVSVPFSLSR